MNPTQLQARLPLTFVGKCQLFMQQVGDAIDECFNSPSKQQHISSLQKLLKKHKHLQFQLLEERSYAPPAYVLRKTGFDPSFLALSKDQTFIEFNSHSELRGYWEVENGEDSLKLTYDGQQLTADASSIQPPEISHIRSFSNHYLIVNCQTDQGDIQRIYTLCQKGS
ncbi:MAG: hypothetical protein AAF587_14865 [Bacteroidota bacterium]